METDIVSDTTPEADKFGNVSGERSEKPDCKCGHSWKAYHAPWHNKECGVAGCYCDGYWEDKKVWCKEPGHAKHYAPPTRHGSCCTCQECGKHYDDCICKPKESAHGLCACKHKYFQHIDLADLTDNCRKCDCTGFKKDTLALSSAEGSGSDNVPLPSGSGEQPTTVEATLQAYGLIQTDPRIMGGEPTITGTRVLVETILKAVAEERRQAKIECLEDLLLAEDIGQGDVSTWNKVIRSRITEFEGRRK